MPGQTEFLSRTKGPSYEEIASKYPPVPEWGEKYSFEVGKIPASAFEEILEVRDKSPQLSRKQVVEIAKAELKRLGFGKVKVRLTRRHGSDPGAQYADATACPIVEKGIIVGKGIKLHPVICYQTPGYIREVIQHEVGHLKEYKLGTRWKE